MAPRGFQGNRKIKNSSGSGLCGAGRRQRRKAQKTSARRSPGQQRKCLSRRLPPLVRFGPPAALISPRGFPNEVPHFFFPAAVWRARDAARDVLSPAVHRIRNLWLRRRARRPNFRPNHFARNNNLNAPVLLPPRGGIITRHRIRLPKSRRYNGTGIQSLLYQIIPHRVRPLLRKRLIERIASHAVRISLDGKMQSRMRQHDPGKFRQSLPRRLLQFIFSEREQHVRHVHLQTARRVRRRQDAIKLIQQRRSQSLLLCFRPSRRFLRSFFSLSRRVSLLLRRQRRRIRLAACRVRLRASSRCLRRIPFRLQFLNFSLLPRRCLLLLSGVRRSHRCLRSCLLSRRLLLRRALQSDGPRVRRRLHCIARRRDHLFPARLLRQQIIRVSQRPHRLLKCVRRQSIRSRALRNRHRIPRFINLQRHLRGKIRDRFPRLRHVVRIAATLQQFVVRRHLLRRSHRIRAHHVFQDHHVARHVHRKIRFGGHDHSKGLQIRRRRQFALIPIQQQFPQIIRLAFRRDRPQHVGQIFLPEFLRRLQILETRAHHDRSLLAIHLRVTLCQRQQRRPLKSNHRRTAAMLITHRRNGFPHHRHIVDRLIPLLRRRRLLLRSRRRAKNHQARNRHSQNLSHVRKLLLYPTLAASRKFRA